MEKSIRIQIETNPIPVGYFLNRAIAIMRCRIFLLPFAIEEVPGVFAYGGIDGEYSVSGDVRAFGQAKFACRGIQGSEAENSLYLLCNAMLEASDYLEEHLTKICLPRHTRKAEKSAA